MPNLYLLYYLALAATVLTSAGMSALLWFKASKSIGVKPLGLFCLGVATWISGHILINTCDGAYLRVGQALVNLSPLTSACFLHFSISFTGNIRQNHVALIYLSAALVSIVAIFSNAGEPAPWLGFRHFYRLDAYAIFIVTFTASLGVAGHFYLFIRGLRSEPRKQRQVMAVFLAGAWGLVSASGFLIGSSGLPLFPYSVLLLPGYTLFLVYGILRYEFMDVNLWARKSLEWVLILAAMLAVISLIVSILMRLGISNVSIWQVWPMSLAAMLIAVLFHRPATELATRLVYPGSWIDTALLAKWQAELDSAESWSQLNSISADLISGHLGHSVQVILGGPELPNSGPAIICRSDGNNWSYSMSGWGSAAPGVLRTIEVFSATLATSAGRLEQALKVAERETEILKESHLAELGSLSATVAHELRNPLNIISMASASCDKETKKEISEQLNRAGRLISDLLAYSGRVLIEKKTLNLREELDYVLSHYDNLRHQGEGQGEGLVETAGPTVINDVHPETILLADAHKLHQVFFNLLDNAFAALKGRDDERLLITAEKIEGRIKVSVCDTGPGIPENIKVDIFHPFISGRTGGTGLGLAIVNRIMEAHGGRVELGKREGFECCFELYFPMEEFK